MLRMLLDSKRKFPQLTMLESRKVKVSMQGENFLWDSAGLTFNTSHERPKSPAHPMLCDLQIFGIRPVTYIRTLEEELGNY